MVIDDGLVSTLRRLGASIGENVFFGPDVYVETDFAPLLSIEDGVVISRGVSIFLHDSALNNVAGEPIKFGQVILRRECYIGANATILCGVEIGSRAVVGACSLVTHDVPTETVAYGCPAAVRSSVNELITRHRQLRTDSDTQDVRFRYLDVLPWRCIRDEKDKVATEGVISEFLQRISKITQAGRIHD